MINLPIIDQNKELSGKRVFVRGDIDIPIQDGKIADDTRLRDIWPTIEFLLEQNCQVVIAGHLGRPEGKEVPELSSKIVANWIAQYVNGEVSEQKFGSIKGYRVLDNLFVLENLRFYPGEEANDESFSKELASTAEIYIDEAFAACERDHASIVGVPKLLPHFAGFRLAKEVEVLSKVIDDPQRPLTVIIGGAKLETKIPLISKMAEIADSVVVGGKLVAEIKVGSPIMGMEKVRVLRLTDNTKDTTLESIDKVLVERIKSSDVGTIVWNGPVGLVEDYSYQVGTRRIAELVAASSAYKIVGGGDTIGILRKLGLIDKYSWVCSGGGSMLTFLAGEKLPGVEALLS